MSQRTFVRIAVLPLLVLIGCGKKQSKSDLEDVPPPRSSAQKKPVIPPKTGDTRVAKKPSTNQRSTNTPRTAPPKQATAKPRTAPATPAPPATPPIPPEPAAEPSAFGAAKPPSTADTRFVYEAGMANLVQMELGRSVLTKDAGEEVKRYAQMMIDNHDRAQQELKLSVEGTRVKVPNEIDAGYRDVINRIMQSSGAEFDRRYVRMMQSEHQMMVNKYEREAREADHDFIRSYAYRFRATMREHLRLANELDKKINGGGTP